MNQRISDDEATLTDIERNALASIKPSASSAIAAIDALVSSAEAALQQAQSQPAGQKTQGNNH